MNRFTAVAIAAAMQAGCSFSPYGETSVLRVSTEGGVSVSAARTLNPLASVTAPTTVDEFDCFAINVMGPGIQGLGTTDASNAACNYQGVTSTLFKLDGSSTEVEMRVPSGSKRRVQMIGIKMADGVSCPVGTSLQDFQAANQTGCDPNAGTCPDPTFMMTEVGRATTDLFGDTVVEIQNQFTGTPSSTPVFGGDCGWMMPSPTPPPI